MEHESFVPAMTTARLVSALRTPGLVAAALPGWQPDAQVPPPGGPAVGRLRLRVGGSTITYRATVRVSGDGPDFVVLAEGTEVRGGGTVKASAEVTVVTAVQPEPGVTVVWRGTADGDGRLAAYEDAVVEAAVRRLLDRFCAELAARAPERGDLGGAARERRAPGTADAEDALSEGVPHADDADLNDDELPEDDADVRDADLGDAARHDEGADLRDLGAASHDPDPRDDDAGSYDPDRHDPGPHGADPLGVRHEPPGEDGEPDVVDDLGEPVPSAELEEFELVEVEVEVPESAAALDDLVPPAEAAHARRTMIGRSAEEVDHAPPRGRYAPVPSPDSTGAAATLRWAAPAAAALVASAVVVGRVLRRRR